VDIDNFAIGSLFDLGTIHMHITLAITRRDECFPFYEARSWSGALHC
jgi:hypothetical protein